jgi:hypothetical protein
MSLIKEFATFFNNRRKLNPNELLSIRFEYINELFSIFKNYEIDKQYIISEIDTCFTINELNKSYDKICKYYFEISNSQILNELKQLSI